MRVAKVAEEVDAGPRAVPVMPLAALAPGLATGEAPDIAGAMRARLGKIADGSLGERKKNEQAEFQFAGGACAAPGCGHDRPAPSYEALGHLRARAGGSAGGLARRFPGRRIAFRGFHGALIGAMAKRSLRRRAQGGVLNQALAKADRDSCPWERGMLKASLPWETWP